MVNPGDYLPSDEEIDIEMFDSDTELSKSISAPQRSAVTDDSESDFESAAPKRKPAAAKRGGCGRGRGRGRGRVATAASRDSADTKDYDGSEVEGEDAFDAPVSKTRRGRPPKTTADSDKPKSTRGRKKAAAKTTDADEDGEYGKPTKKRTAAAKGKARQTTLDEIELPPKEAVFDPEKNNELAAQYPDPYWHELSVEDATTDSMDGVHTGRIDFIDEEHPLELLPHSIRDQMALTGMALSADGAMLATFGSSASVHIWDTDTFELLTTLHDREEPNIDEFFVGQFTPSSEYLVVGGKLKDRKRWSEADEDNHILPCPLKIFNVLTGEVVGRLEGHSEEILCIKSVVYKGENYFVTTSQDGYIRRWSMSSDWMVLQDTKEVTDGVTCMAFTVSFLPNTGNRFFIASTDDHLTLVDLDQCKIVQRFDPIYSSYCDCGKFIEPVEAPLYQKIRPSIDVNDTVTAEGGAENSAAGGSSTDPQSAHPSEPAGPHAYFITRGVELLDAENNTVSSRPNTCTLHRLVYPTEPDGKFELQEIRRYHHDEYLSNSWLIRITSNGRYILAPTLNGQVFVFSIATGQVTGILRDHETIEVRDCKFHPTKNLLFTCGDDGSVKVYQSVVRPKPTTPAVDEDAVMEGVGTSIDDAETPRTAAVSPLATLKDRIETMAVHENTTVSVEPTPTAHVANNNISDSSTGVVMSD